MEKEEVQEIQETDSKNKNLIWIIIGIACLIVIIVIILILFFFFKGSGKADISPGPGIETIELQDNKLLITKTDLDTQDVSKIKFILKDKNNEQYSYETYQVSNTYYELDASDFGLDDFNDIKEVLIVYSYDTVANTEPINQDKTNEEDDSSFIEDIEYPLPESNNSCRNINDCNDRINCTRDFCINYSCYHTTNDNICSDNNYCNGLEYCNIERGCISGTPIDCSSLNEACMQGICSETNKSCVKIPGLNGNSCNDNANCTINDICMNGTCTGTPDNTKCSDNIACTNDICFNKNCSHFPNDFACGSDYKCDIFSGCVQSSCSGCDDCDNFYTNCDYTKCHNNCRKTQDCYFKGGLDSCVTKNYACSNLIRNCSDYNLLECQNDPCNLDCKLDNERCIKNTTVIEPVIPLVCIGFTVDENKKRQIASLIESSGIRGGFLVMQCGQVIYKGAIGGNTLDTQYDLASTSKQFTASAIMILEQQGKLSTSDVLEKYLPGYASQGDKITIHHLLTHTSGIDTGTTPGTRYSYSNYGYKTLKNIITKVSGMEAGDFITKYIIEPTNMTRTHTLNYRGSGGIYSIVEDMYKWDRMLYTEKILSNVSKEKMFTPFLNNYGYGWFIQIFPGHKVIYHNGDVSVYRNNFVRFLDQDTVIIVLSNNSNSAAAYTIATKIGKILFAWY